MTPLASSLLVAVMGCSFEQASERRQEPAVLVADLMADARAGGVKVGHTGFERIFDPAGRAALSLSDGVEGVFIVWLEPGWSLVIEGQEGARADLELEIELDPRAGAAHSGGAVNFDLGRYRVQDGPIVVPLSEALTHGPAAARLRVLAREGSVSLSRAELRSPPIPSPAEKSAIEEPEAQSQPVQSQPNLIVYLIDTLRPDHLGLYGYQRASSPHLDAFAERATVFERAVAQSSWTKAGVASIFTGLWPYAHGANSFRHLLSEHHEVLAERLRAAGYTTAAFTTNPNITAEFGFAQGFDHFADLRQKGSRSLRVQQAFERWLESRPPGMPFFAYLHTIDPHAPYSPPEPHRQRFSPRPKNPEVGSREQLNDLQSGRLPATPERVDALIDLYDGEVAANDASFGRLLRLLRASGLEETTVVVVLSDHGEEFYEHGGFTHGKKLFAESVRIPLLLRLPGQRARRDIALRVEQVDLYSTLLDVAGVGSTVVDGRSLVPLLSGRSLEPRPTFGYLHLSGMPRAVVWDRQYKLIRHLRAAEGGGTALFDLLADPGEQQDLSVAMPVLNELLSRRIDLKLGESEPAAPERTDIDPTTRKQLEALGYLQ